MILQHVKLIHKGNLASFITRKIKTESVFFVLWTLRKQWYRWNR